MADNPVKSFNNNRTCRIASYSPAEEKGNKWAIRIALGAYDIYNVTGWLSDLLSYSRLLALGLATGVIASVVNSMGSMIGDGPVGIIVFIIVFIVGHTLNLAINLLGAYVHTNRLQYVEFFGNSMIGGVQSFNPFTLKTKYVELDNRRELIMELWNFLCHSWRSVSNFIGRSRDQQWV